MFGVVKRHPVLTGVSALTAGGILLAASLYNHDLPDPETIAAREFSNRPVATAPLVTREPARKPEPKTLKTYRGFENPAYSIWDRKIIDSVEQWNEKYEKYKHLPGWEPLDPELFKALCLYECRGGNIRAFRHNPAQFGNKGDPGFIVMRDGGEYGIPEGGYEELQSFKPIPPKIKITRTKNGKIKKRFIGWDFEADGIITPEVAIEFAVGWLWHKKCIYGNAIIEEGPVRTYIVRSGDNLSTIARRFKTTVKTIQKYTPSITDPNKIYVGQEIRYREACMKPVIVGFRKWKEAVKRYNGGGDPNYLDGVLTIYKNPTDSSDANQHVAANR